MNILKNKKILLIICGGISAYKSLELIRLLKKEKVEIKTILTKNSKKFITPLSVTSLTQNKIYDDLFNAENESEMDHISLSRWCDAIVIVPATANTISKLSFGKSDDFASTNDKKQYLLEEFKEFIDHVFGQNNHHMSLYIKRYNMFRFDFKKGGYTGGKWWRLRKGNRTFGTKLKCQEHSFDELNELFISIGGIY